MNITIRTTDRDLMRQIVDLCAGGDWGDVEVTLTIDEPAPDYTSRWAKLVDNNRPNYEAAIEHAERRRQHRDWLREHFDEIIGEVCPTCASKVNEVCKTAAGASYSWPNFHVGRVRRWSEAVDKLNAWCEATDSADATTEAMRARANHYAPVALDEM